jgi:hypothetical protein
MNLRTTDLNGALKIRILALSAAEPPGKRLVLEVLGRHLTDSQADGIAFDARQIDETVSWLMQTFAVEFTTMDVAAVQSPEAREVLLHLAEKAGSTP